MSYVVKEIFYTLQGEGAHAGRPAVLCRFSGCNLWTGREHDRQRATCRLCDTDFVGTDGANGGRFASARQLADAIRRVWMGEAIDSYVVFTGGEPTLQLDEAVIAAARERGFSTAIETNGTREVSHGLDWVCVSPKARAPLRQRAGDELKLVFPQPLLDPASFEHLPFRYLFLQPCDDAERAANTRAAVAYCLRHPRWRLSLQTHKLLGIR